MTIMHNRMPPWKVIMMNDVTVRSTLEIIEGECRIPLFVLSEMCIYVCVQLQPVAVLDNDLIQL